MTCCHLSCHSTCPKSFLGSTRTPQTTLKHLLSCLVLCISRYVSSLHSQYINTQKFDINKTVTRRLGTEIEVGRHTFITQNSILLRVYFLSFFDLKLLFTRKRMIFEDDEISHTNYIEKVKKDKCVQTTWRHHLEFLFSSFN